MDEITFGAGAFAVFTAFRDKFPAPTGSSENDEEMRRQWTHRLAQQLAFSRPNDGWGHKSAGAGRPHSSDVVARQVGGQLVGFDMLIAAGTSSQHYAEANVEPIDLTGQIFEPVEPWDFIGGTGGGTGGGESIPDDIVQILADINAKFAKVLVVAETTDAKVDKLSTEHQSALLEIKKIADAELEVQVGGLPPISIKPKLKG